MKQIKYNNQNQPFTNSDFELQNDEIYKAIEDQYKGKPAFVISGCTVSGLNVAAGLCYIEGKIVELEAATVAAFPRYIKMTQVDYDPRLHPQSSSNLDTKTNYKAEIVDSTSGLTDYITITSVGCNRRLQNYFSDENGQILGKTYVKASTTYASQSGTGTIVIDSYTEAYDYKNEFDDSAGEFTATKAGLYQISLQARIDFPSGASKSGSINIEVNRGSGWVALASVYDNTVADFEQYVRSVSDTVFLEVWDKIRATITTTGPSVSVHVPNLSIVDVG